MKFLLVDSQFNITSEKMMEYPGEKIVRKILRILIELSIPGTRKWCIISVYFELVTVFQVIIYKYCSNSPRILVCIPIDGFFDGYVDGYWYATY